MYTKDRYTELPENAENVILSEWYFPKSTKGSIKYSIIPSCKGGILLDGINDFGKVIDMPIYKDYTFIIDREIISIGNTAGIVASKFEDSTDVNKQGAFLFEYLRSPNNVSAWSFYKDNGKVANTDFTRGISYQSKYSYNGIELLAGTALDSDKLWLGILRDKDSRFANVAIYSLMSFPYSMSEFLIERQLKKHKLGTLYPNMVEFRPIIKSNVNYQDIIFRNTSTGENLIVGQYYNLESISIYVKLLYYEEVSTIKVNNINAEFNSYDKNTGYYRFDCIVTKSPQKINLTIEQDENYVQYNPVVESNAEYSDIAYLNYSHNIATINVGDYINVGDTVGIRVILNSTIDEVVNCKVNGQECEIVNVSPRVFDCKFTLTSESPQKINITIDEYIRYEDIVQPYPVVFQITDRNTNQRYSWGDKIKVGSSIQLTQGENPNLLSGLYSVQSYEYEGETYTYNQLKALVIIITKSGIQLSCNKVWTFDDNEPKCILSPRLLRIPNSSYKILGYIPDISGHGNHGVIHNSAYVEGSGVNEDGSYQFDGVDDFVTIPTVTGGKQVLMKVNWQSGVGAVTLYDQRLNISDYEFAIYNGTRDLDDNPVMAYQGRNNGQTYIDGILNSNIMASELKAITHNITITNELSLGINNTYPVIGSTRSNTHFAQMSLYDFMLFDEISTDDKIKELNKYVGVEAKVELPPYYWDTYGKTNSDADRDVIQQRGIAVGDYDLTNYNHAYDKMSGYGGYKFAKFDNELDWYLTPDNGYIDVVSRNGYSITLRNLSTSNYGWYFQNSTVKEFITKDIPFKVKANKSIRVYWDMHSYKSNGENFGYVVNNITLNPNEDTSINLRHLTEEELTELDANKDRMYYLLWFDLSTLAVDEEVTIEMLPLYPNGLAYDGITDYSKNANIPVLTDYTYIYKRTIINIPTNAATLLKGADKTNGGAFIADYGNKWQFNFGQYNIIQGIADGINWQTVNSFNGTSINKGENTDDSGITVAKFSNGYTSMVFYKLILYPKTISLLEINFLKNLMEKDEIIDLNNPIFIKNE